MSLSIKTLRYNALLEQVQVGIAGKLDQMPIQIALQFPFKAGEALNIRMREAALFKAEQILRAAVSMSLSLVLSKQDTEKATTRESRWSRDHRRAG